MPSHDPSSSSTIHWRSWSAEAFREAQQANKPVLLDISAVWCHWCHVMDRTSYADPEVVRLTNALFIPIRVENDVRPDINERYNQGGWPTTAFLTPSGEVIHGATYVPPEQMRELLPAVSHAYEQHRDEIARQVEAVQRRRVTRTRTSRRALDLQQIIADVTRTLRHNADSQHGGFGHAPKFPVPDAVNFALAQYEVTGDVRLRDIATKALDGMLGLYDKVDGGFHRYSVTPDWQVPHYEKMLEGNAGLAASYAAGYLVTGDERYADVVRGVLKYMLTTLHDDQGGVYGSQDADVGSHEEGAEFVTGEEFFPLSRKGRAKIGTPHVDKTVYSAWNGMCITALVEGYRALGAGEYLREA